MLLTLALPLLNDYMTHAVIKSIYTGEGARLEPGTKFIDLSVDLSRATARDCPPISYFRIVPRERVWVRRLTVAAGDEIAIGAPIGQFSADPDGPLDTEPARALRVTIAGIVYQAEWWDQP